MSAEQLRLVTKVGRAWDATPHLRFGQLIESVENVGWDMVAQRVSSPRLCWMGDDLFEAALDQWTNVPMVRKVVAA